MDGSTLLDQLLPALRSPLGAVAFVPLYALWVTLLLPGVWASMLAGVLYGPLWGSGLVFAGACLGAQAVFLLGRSRWRGWARRRLAGAPRLLAVERAVCRQGLVLVLLTRLSPGLPLQPAQPRLRPQRGAPAGLRDRSDRDPPGHGALLRPGGGGR